MYTPARAHVKARTAQNIKHREDLSDVAWNLKALIDRSLY